MKMLAGALFAVALSLPAMPVGAFFSPTGLMYAVMIGSAESWLTGPLGHKCTATPGLT